MDVQFDGSAAVASYTKAFRRMHTLPNFDHRMVLRAEAGSILKQWAGRTKVAKNEEADMRARYRAGKRAFGDVGGASSNPYRISVNTGVRGGVPGWTWYMHPSGRFMLAGYIDDTSVIHPNPTRHFKDDAYAKIIAGMEAYADSLAGTLPFARKSVSVSRQSVVQIADDLGIDLSTVKGQGVGAAGVAKARAAIASTGIRYKNGTGTQQGDDVRFFVRLTNRLPFGVKSGMDRTLAGVIAGRAKFIEKAYEKGAFDSMRGVARSFPNVFRTLNLSV